MKDLATIFINYFWVFGALMIWPILNYWTKVPFEKLRILMWLFWLQVFWLLASYVAIQYYRIAGYEDWLHGLILPYLVGAISWLLVVAGLLEMGFGSNKKAIER